MHTSPAMTKNPVFLIAAIRAVEMRCYRKILHISYKDHVTNEEVCAEIQQVIRPHEDLLTIIKGRKLKWYGRVSRSPGLAKSILQGTVKGGRRQDRQRKRWEDNIGEQTGLELAKSLRAVENWEKKWRELIARSSVVTQRPPRLRDGWRRIAVYRARPTSFPASEFSSNVEVSCVMNCESDFSRRFGVGVNFALMWPPQLSGR